jgi:hypothetical protein
MQHPGSIINIKSKLLEKGNVEKEYLEKLKAEIVKKKLQRNKTERNGNDNEEEFYVYACCQKGLN